MKYTEERKHLCVLCKAAEVVELRTVETTDAVPDQCNCDLNKYRDYTLEGGKLLACQKNTIWTRVSDAKATSLGALCTGCLANPDLADLIPHINFEKQ